MGDTAAANSVPEGRLFTITDLKEHVTEKDCYLLLNGKVYDVTDFLDEHPGGYDIILNTTGKDATEDFEEIGHSNAARAMLDKYLIGDFKGSASTAAADSTKSAAKAVASVPSSDDGSALGTLLKALLPLLIILVAAYFALGSKK